MKPYEFGEQLRDKLITKYDFLKDIKIMGPGFINFYIKEEVFVQENLKSIENGDFKKIMFKGKDVKIAIILDRLSDILTLQNFRVFMNMYYLGSLYSFVGCRVERIVVIKNYENSLNMKYFLSNFRQLEVTHDEIRLKGCVTFCHTSNQGLLTGIEKQRMIVEGANIYKNKFPVYDYDLNDLLEEIGIDRIKYTLCNRPITKEGAIELTRNDLRYIQYPYSRISSIINMFKNEGIDIDNIEECIEESPTNPLQQKIIKKILGFKEAVMNSINQNQPYKFIKYANELCEIFYQINADTLFRQLEHDELISILKLLNGVKIVMKEILTILEVPIYEKM